MNKKVLSRLGVFFVGVPLISGIMFLKQYNHLAMHILVAIVSIIASGELYHIFSHNFKLQNKKLIIALTTLIHLVMLARAIFEFNVDYVTYAYIFTILFSLGFEVFSRDEFTNSNGQIVATITILTYVGFLFTFISRLGFMENSRALLIMFITMVFMCDSLAWFFGVLFGKNNKGFVKASPNKSLIGFAGGFVGSILCGLLNYYFNQEIYTGSILKIVILGACVASTSIVGDLVESVFKRSSDCKDSGSIIPGRGGLLDSIDSIVFSAPVFYILVSNFYPNI